MSKSNRENKWKGDSFQNAAAEILSNYFKVKIKPNKAIAIGKPPKKHVFDFASVDGKYYGESKNLTWTESDNIPSAKMAAMNEAVLYLRELPNGLVRFIAMRAVYSEKKHDTLASYYYRTYKHLLYGVTILEIDIENNSVETYGLDE